MFTTLVFAPLALAAPVPKATKKPADEAALVGVWELTTATYNGGEYPSAVGTKWTLQDDGTAVRDRPQQGIAKATYKLDPKAEPKAFDWHTDEGNQFLGVYELDGDTFRVCLSVADTRPAKLTDSKGCYVFEFKRKKEGK